MNEFKNRGNQYQFFFQFQDFRFLCPNDTVFDQQNLVCTNWFEVDCRQSVQLFAQDFGFRAEEEQRQTDPGRGNIARYITFQTYAFFICFIQLNFLANYN